MIRPTTDHDPTGPRGCSLESISLYQEKTSRLGSVHTAFFTQSVQSLHISLYQIAREDLSLNTKVLQTESGYPIYLLIIICRLGTRFLIINTAALCVKSLSTVRKYRTPSPDTVVAFFRAGALSNTHLCIIQLADTLQQLADTL